MVDKKVIPFDLAEPLSTVVDNVCEDDKKWFEAHPEEKKRIRKYVMGELYPMTKRPNYIIVYKISEVCRARVPVFKERLR